MADQTSVINGRGVSPARVAEGMFGNIVEFGTNITSLAELQAKLAVADAKETASRVTIYAVLAASGLVMLLATLPVILLGLAYWAASALKWEMGGAALLVGGITFGLAATTVGFSLRKLGAGFTSFDRSREELTRNLAWIKTVIAQSGRAPVRQRP